MKMNLINREKRLRRQSKRLNLKFMKGKNDQVDNKEIRKYLRPGYMVADGSQGCIIAGWNVDGVFQLDIDQAEIFLMFYEHMEAIKRLDLKAIGIEHFQEEN